MLTDPHKGFVLDIAHFFKHGGDKFRLIFKGIKKCLGPHEHPDRGIDFPQNEDCLHAFRQRPVKGVPFGQVKIICRRPRIFFKCFPAGNDAIVLQSPLALPALVVFGLNGIPFTVIPSGARTGSNIPDEVVI